MKMVYGHIRNSNIPEVKKIELNDEDDCNIRVIYADDIEEREYIFEEEDIHRIDGCDYISSKIKMEFLINAGYLKIEYWVGNMKNEVLKCRRNLQIMRIHGSF